MDLCLYAKNHGINPDQVAKVTDLTSEQVGYVFDDIDKKRSTTGYLHMKPLLLAEVPEVCF